MHQQQDGIVVFIVLQQAARALSLREEAGYVSTRCADAELAAGVRAPARMYDLRRRGEQPNRDLEAIARINEQLGAASGNS